VPDYARQLGYLRCQNKAVASLASIFGQIQTEGNAFAAVLSSIFKGHLSRFRGFCNRSIEKLAAFQHNSWDSRLGSDPLAYARRMMAFTLELDAVTKAFDEFIAVDSLSFNICEGEIFGLLGPNGAGKTSSIRMMIGITVPDSGSVRIFGQPLTRRLLDRVGYLPEERGLYKKMRIMENLVFLAQLKGISVPEANRRANYWLERLELGGWANSKVEELSKGMQQKVQFIAAVIHEPDFLILDEPFSGLDPASSLVLKDALLDLKKQGKTILFSTHRMDTVERLCDSICLVNQGRSVLLGLLREIKSGYGRSSIQLEYDGELPLLADPNLVASSNDFGNYVELRLASGANPQHFLELAMRTAKIHRFELVEPSLEEIFIDTVESTKAVSHA
jgi:ABC-2 type transport system ATP-binding protein